MMECKVRQSYICLFEGTIQTYAGRDDKKKVMCQDGH